MLEIITLWVLIIIFTISLIWFMISSNIKYYYNKAITSQKFKNLPQLAQLKQQISQKTKNIGQKTIQGAQAAMKNIPSTTPLSSISNVLSTMPSLRRQQQ